MGTYINIIRVYYLLGRYCKYYCVLMQYLLEKIIHQVIIILYGRIVIIIIILYKYTI